MIIVNYVYLLMATFIVMAPRIALYFAVPDSRIAGFRLHEYVKGNLKRRSDNNSDKTIEGRLGVLKIPFGGVYFVHSIFQSAGVVVGIINIYEFFIDIIIYPVPGGFTPTIIFREILMLLSGILLVFYPISAPTRYESVIWLTESSVTLFSILCLPSILGRYIVIFPVIPLLAAMIPVIIHYIFGKIDDYRKLYDISGRFDRVFGFFPTFLLFILIGIEWAAALFGRSLIDLIAF